MQLANSLQKREAVSPATSMIVKAVLLYKSAHSNEKKKKNMTSILDLFSFSFLRFPGTSMVGW